MFKIAYCAGHYLGTAGKRLPVSLDPGQTREWVLNNRVAEYFARAAGEYPQVSLLRTDDPTGATYRGIPERTALANRWGADLYIDMHHNAAGKLFSGGGVEVYSCPGSTGGRGFRDAIYEALLAGGGLKGNRTSPLLEKGYDSLTMTRMPAVLIEYGYMDSKVDAPVILTDAYAEAMGRATMAGVAGAMGWEKPEELYSLADFAYRIQQVCGAVTDGIAGPETLGKTPTVSATKNPRHPVVAAVQKRLFALGYRQVGPSDGIAGPKFTEAVTAFQRDHGCVPDGELTGGCKTWRRLLCMDGEGNE